MSAEHSSSSLARCFCGGELGPGVHPLYGSCRECGTQVQRERVSPEVLTSFYGLESYWHGHVVEKLGFPSIEERAVSDAGERVAYWISLAAALGRPPKSLLEIGCAHGGFLAKAVDWGVELAAGIEVDPATCAFARERFGLTHVYPGLFPDVSLPVERFSAVCGFDVIEHFLDPVAALARVAAILEPGGYFLFQTPCYRGQEEKWLHFQPNEHLFLYTEAGLAKLFALAGLRLDFLAPGYFDHDVFAVGGIGPARRRGGTALVRSDSIGDSILFSGALPLLSEGDRFGPLTLICQDHVAALYAADPHLADIIGYNRYYLTHLEQYQAFLRQALKRPGFDAAVNTVFSREDVADMLAINTGAPMKIALAGDLVNTKPEQRGKADAFYDTLIPSPGAWKPELARTRDLLSGLGVAAGEIQPKIHIGQAERDFAARVFDKHGLGGEVLALYCGAQFPQRLYLHYGAALARLARERGMAVIALGSDKDLSVAERNLADLGVPAVNLFGRTSLPQAAALLARCRLAVGAETGLAHLACALGIPNAVLLGGGHFGRFMPWSALTTVACLPLDCFGCDWSCRFEHVYCVASLAPHVFAAACRAALDGPADRPRIFYQPADQWPGGPDNPAWTRQRAGELLDGCQWIEADRALGLDPVSRELCARADALAGAGGWEAALALYSKALAKAPGAAWLMGKAAACLEGLDRGEQALAMLGRAFAADPHDGAVAGALVRLLKESGQADLAGEVAGVHLDLHPESRGLFAELPGQRQPGDD